MDEDEKMLLQLKSKMSKQQQADMKELIDAELKRRMDEKGKAQILARAREKSSVKSSQLSSSLDNEHLAQMYSELDGDVRSLRLRKLEAQLEDAKRQAARYGKVNKAKRPAAASPAAFAQRALGDAPAEIYTRIRGRGNARGFLLMAGIVGLAALKVVFSTGVVDASSAGLKKAPAVREAEVKQEPRTEPAAEAKQLPAASALAGIEGRLGELSEPEKQVLLALDARRVELDRRRTALEQKENDLRSQNQALAERIAELRSLTTRVAEQRKERDSRYEARLEQLATVYGSMVPQEAAPLMAKLDEEIALALLERMPGKRMGQILSVMETGRAVELTKRLSDRGKV